MRVQLLTSDIVAYHQLQARRDKRAKPMIVKFFYNVVKRDDMMARKNLKGTKRYVKE